MKFFRRNLPDQIQLLVTELVQLEQTAEAEELNTVMTQISCEELSEIRTRIAERDETSREKRSYRVFEIAKRLRKQADKIVEHEMQRRLTSLADKIDELIESVKFTDKSVKVLLHESATEARDGLAETMTSMVICVVFGPFVPLLLVAILFLVYVPMCALAHLRKIGEWHLQTVAKSERALALLVEELEPLISASSESYEKLKEDEQLKTSEIIEHVREVATDSQLSMSAASEIEETADFLAMPQLDVPHDSDHAIRQSKKDHQDAKVQRLCVLINTHQTLGNHSLAKELKLYACEFELNSAVVTLLEAIILQQRLVYTHNTFAFPIIQKSIAHNLFVSYSLQSYRIDVRIFCWSTMAGFFFDLDFEIGPCILYACCCLFEILIHRIVACCSEAPAEARNFASPDNSPPRSLEHFENQLDSSCPLPSLPSELSAPAQDLAFESSLVSKGSHVSKDGSLEGPTVGFKMIIDAAIPPVTDEIKHCFVADIELLTAGKHMSTHHWEIMWNDVDSIIFNLRLQPKQGSDKRDKLRYADDVGETLILEQSQLEHVVQVAIPSGSYLPNVAAHTIGPITLALVPAGVPSVGPVNIEIDKCRDRCLGKSIDPATQFRGRPFLENTQMCSKARKAFKRKTKPRRNKGNQLPTSAPNKRNQGSPIVVSPVTRLSHDEIDRAGVSNQGSALEFPLHGVIVRNDLTNYTK